MKCYTKVFGNATKNKWKKIKKKIEFLKLIKKTVPIEYIRNISKLRKRSNTIENQEILKN